MKESILEVEELKKYYNDVKAVDGISFKVLKGEVFTLLGPNGAGKTTTLEILEGLKSHDGGKITLFNEDVRNKVARHLREKVGVVLQENNFIDHLTVQETLAMFRNLYQKGIGVQEVIKIISLGEKKRARVEKLSGGQKQRLAIGVALVGDPEMIFMDEPTTGLDPQARRNVWDMVEMLRDQGKTVFLTTHYMEEAEVLSDYIYIMDHGKIIAKGTVAKLISTYGGDKIVEMTVKSDPETLSKFKGEFKGMRVEENTKVTIDTTELPVTMKKLLDTAEEYSIKIEDMAVRQSNLEDVFLNLTGRRLRD